MLPDVVQEMFLTGELFPTQITLMRRLTYKGTEMAGMSLDKVLFLIIT